MTFYVATDGNDANPGTKAKPFGTIERARDAVRSQRANSRTPPEKAVVCLRAGTYRLKRSLTLDKRDSFTTYRALPGEKVRLSGGLVVPPSCFKPVTSAAVRKRLARAAVGRVRVLDLSALGLEELPQLADKFRGGAGQIELFFNTEPMRVSRWPDTGWAAIAKVIDKGNVPRRGERGKRPGKFTYSGNRPKNWRVRDGVWLTGYWSNDWYEEAIRIRSIDTEKRTITLSAPAVYGLGGYATRRYYAQNLLEELDKPGEWYVDRKNALLYFYPPSSLEKAETALSVLDKPLVQISKAKGIILEGMTFEAVRGGAITIIQGSGNRVRSCFIRNTGGNGVVINGGTDNGCEASEIANTGAGGVNISGGERRTLTPSGNFAVNNHIHHFGRLVRTYAGAIHLSGVGNRAAHNYIHHAPHVAISFGGNEHIMEYNEIHNVCDETGDVGVFYTGRDWTARGNVIRYNFIHNVFGPGVCGAQGVYLDDMASGTIVRNNVLYRVQMAVLCNGGRDNIIEHNVMASCPGSIRFACGSGLETMSRRLKGIPYKTKPWSERYPQLLTILADDPASPKGNVIRKNVLWNSGKMALAKEVTQFGKVKDNLVAKAGLGFADTNRMDFRLSKGSVVFKKLPGFKPIPMDKIGPKIDKYRKTLPVRMPTIAPARRTFVGSIKVRLFAPNQHTKPVIRYTLDGSEPTAESTLYTSPLELTDTTTVKAAAFVDSPVMARSATAAVTFAAGRLGKAHGVPLAELTEQDPGTYAFIPLIKKTNFSSAAITLGGREYTTGFVIYPAATSPDGREHVTYKLDGGLRDARRLTAVIGIEKVTGKRKDGAFTYIVEVHRNGKWQRIFESPALKVGGKPQKVDVDVTGADKLRLVTIADGGDIKANRTLWADAMVQ